MSSRRLPVIGICASTGGPHTLELVLQRLPADFPIPVLVVQHMTPGFIEINVSNWLKAGGALGVFVIIYFYSPASLVANP